VVLSVFLMTANAVPALGQDKSGLALQAQAVFKNHCLKCHGNEESQYFNARDLATLKRKAESDNRPYITPGKPDESVIWDYIKDKSGSMPKSGEERRTFTDAQRQIIRDWITAGAPDFPREKARSAITLRTTLETIWKHASSANQRDLPYLRYFTLTHQHNNSLHHDSIDLALTRAGLAKAINSLSWAQQIVLPEVVPESEGTILVVNIGKLGWTRELWNSIAKRYPYAMGFANHDDDILKELDDKLRKLFNNREELIHLRADWFVATATRPPLYNQILYDLSIDTLRKRPDDPKLPNNRKQMKASDLEAHLGVNVVANLLAKNPETIRAGFPSSGVSSQNRLIERHPLRGQGAYWKSYDFKSSTWEANLQQFPLGPRFDGNPFDKLAFKHDGGEIIFHLPNGLQGYLLVDGNDNRIDEGPIAVVSDSTNTTGTPVVVNGISCMSCHRNGMRPAPADQVRFGKGVFGEARERVKALYPEKKTIDAAIERDAQIFQAAQKRTIGPFLRADEEANGEPIFMAAQKYFAVTEDLDAATVACELYLDNPKQLVDKTASSDVLRELGLGALAIKDGKIKRSAWESVRGTSQMQQAAREFGYSPR